MQLRNKLHQLRNKLHQLRNKLHQLRNKLHQLRNKLHQLDVSVISNVNLIEEHLGYKSLHLNNRGSSRLAWNYLAYTRKHSQLINTNFTILLNNNVKCYLSEISDIANVSEYKQTSTSVFYVYSNVNYLSTQVNEIGFTSFNLNPNTECFVPHSIQSISHIILLNP